jgi:hypothetical protein
MPGRPKKNNRKREETEKPLGKKMSKHGTIIKCSLCGTSGHNKSGCKSNPNRGKKDKVHLTKKNSNEVCFPYTCKLCFRELKQVSTATYIYINALFVCLYYRELKQVHLELLPQELFQNLELNQLKAVHLKLLEGEEHLELLQGEKELLDNQNLDNLQHHHNQLLPQAEEVEQKGEEGQHLHIQRMLTSHAVETIRLVNLCSCCSV